MPRHDLIIVGAGPVGMTLALDSLTAIVVLLGGYFIAFNILEATLPSLISKIAPADAKGTAIGVYNTAQSLGLFLGAAAGGWLYSHGGAPFVFAFCSALMLLWLLMAITMRPPRAVRTQMLALPDGWQGNPATLSARLRALHGVEEAVVIAAERVAYLKVAQTGWDEAGASQSIRETQ